MAQSQVKAQEVKEEGLLEEKFSAHYQTTVVTQYKPPFSAKYTGENSLLPTEETQTSLTSTIYLGAKLWKGASIFGNMEISGGSGLSSVLGLGDATNGETYQVGSTAPNVFSPFFLRQVFALDNILRNINLPISINWLANNLQNMLPLR